MYKKELIVDVIDIATGEIYKSFDTPYSGESKRYINWWIKWNGFKFVKVHYEGTGVTTVWVEEVER